MTHLKFPRGPLDPLPGHDRSAGGEQVPDHGVRGALRDVAHEHGDGRAAGDGTPRLARVVRDGLAGTPGAAGWHPAHRGRSPHTQGAGAEAHGWRGSNRRRRSVPGHGGYIRLICKQQILLYHRIKYRKAQERKQV